MKFVLACYGTRGDVEPCAAIARELVRRGHEVHMAVPPDLVSFVESVGLTAVACGPEAREWQDMHRAFLTQVFRKFWKVRDLVELAREDWGLLSRCLREIDSTLVSLADGADLLLTLVIGDQPATNVAEYYDIPLATLHTRPIRANGQFVPEPLAPLVRSLMAMSEWLEWPLTKKFEDVQRRQLGLPKARRPWPQRMRQRKSLEIQAYEEIFFPGLADEWARWDGQRPFVGALTLELPTDADAEVAAWIAAGTPPIFFGFGSTLVKSPADTIAMISAACARLGERALICAAESDFSEVPHFDHVKVVGTMNYAAAFPSCRAVVHHGGAGTTAAGLRAGVPQMIISTWLDQTLWGARVKRLGVGTARRFSTTEDELVADLRTILAPEYVARAREIAPQMTEPGAGVNKAADSLEDFARRGVLAPRKG
jgi:UDP:flavonoid glycosyltransferase YjiC (YdhE family)